MERINKKVYPRVQHSLLSCGFLSVSWSGVTRIATGLSISTNTFSGALNHASPSGSLTDESGLADARRMLLAFTHNLNSKFWWMGNNALAVYFFHEFGWTHFVSAVGVKPMWVQHLTAFCTEGLHWGSDFCYDSYGANQFFSPV